MPGSSMLTGVFAFRPSFEDRLTPQGFEVDCTLKSGGRVQQRCNNSTGKTRVRIIFWP